MENKKDIKKNKKIGINKKIIIPVVTLALAGTTFYAIKNTQVKENIQSFTGIYENKNTNTEARVAYTFPDPNLQAAVLERLKEYNGDNRTWMSKIAMSDTSYRKEQNDNTIYLDELEKITRINIEEKNIQSTSGIEKLKNLESLSLYDSHVTDITGIGKLEKLNFLDLSLNRIENISEISKVKSLMTLHIYYIDNIEFLSELNNLRALVIRHSSVKDLSTITTLSSMNSLNILYSELEDISVLEKLTNLSYLDLRENKIKDFGSLRGKNLNHPMLIDQNITVSAVDNKVKIKLVDEMGNNIEINNPRLEKIETEENTYKVKGITDLSPISFGVVNKDNTLHLWNVTINPNKPKIVINYKKDGELIKTEEKEYEPNAENGITVGTKFEEAGKNYTVSNIDNIPARITENGTYDVEVTEDIQREVVQINDPILRKVILEVLRKNEFSSDYKIDGYVKPENETEIYQDELDTIFRLDLIEYSDNIKTIDISDIAKIKKLEELNIKGYRVTNSEVLSNLKRLTHLVIDLNNIENAGLIRLEGETPYPDHEFYSNDKLKTQKINNIIDTVSKISTLESLVLRDLEIEDISGIEKLTNLGILDLSRNNISNLKAVKKLKQLRHISVRMNKVEDVTDLNTFNNINIDVGVNNIKDLSPLSNISRKSAAIYTDASLGSQYIDLKTTDGTFEVELKTNKGTKVEITDPRIEKTNNPEKPNEYRIKDLESFDGSNVYVLYDRVIEPEEPSDIESGPGGEIKDRDFGSWILKIKKELPKKVNVTINYKNKAGEIIKTEAIEKTVGDNLEISDNFTHNEKNYVVKDKSAVPARIGVDGGTFDVIVAETVNMGIIENIIPVAPVKIDKVELKTGETLTMDMVKEKITGLDPNATLEEVDGSITNFDSNTPGEKTIKVKIVNENGSSRIIEVPVKVSMKLTPIMPVDTEETKLGKVVEEKILKGEKIDLTDNILGLPKNVKVEDITEEKIDTNKPGRYVGKVKVTYPNGVIRRVEIPVEITLEKVENIDVKGKLKIEGEVGKGFEVIVRLYENGKPTDKTVRVTEETGEYVFSNLPKTDIYEKEKVYGVEIENENILVANGYKVELEKNGDIKVVGKKKEDKLSNRILPKAGGETRSVVLTMLAFAVAPIIYFGRKMFKK